MQEQKVGNQRARKVRGLAKQRLQDFEKVMRTKRRKLGDRERGKKRREGRQKANDKRKGRKKGAWTDNEVGQKTVLMVLCGSAGKRAASFEQERRTSNPAGKAVLSRGYIRERRGRVSWNWATGIRY
jgi:hypothetical protein